MQRSHCVPFEQLRSGLSLVGSVDTRQVDLGHAGGIMLTKWIGRTRSLYSLREKAQDCLLPPSPSQEKAD